MDYYLSDIQIYHIRFYLRLNRIIYNNKYMTEQDRIELKNLLEFEQALEGRGHKLNKKKQIRKLELQVLQLQGQ